MATPWEDVPQEEIDRASAEVLALRSCVHEFFDVFRTIDDHLALLLSQIICFGKDYGIAIYFAPNGVEIRFAIVDAAMKLLFNGEEHEEAALAAWKNLLDRLQKVRVKRNKIAHGVPDIQLIKGKAHARITDSVLRLYPNKELRNSPSGMTLHEIKEAISMARRCQKGILSFSLFVVVQTRDHQDDSATLQNICLQLESHLKKNSDHDFVPTQ